MPPTAQNPYDTRPQFTPAQSQQIAVSLDADGVLAPKSFEQETSLAEYLLRSGCLPGGYRNPSQLLVAFQFLKQHKVPFLAGIRCIAIIRGSVCIWGDLPLALVRRSGMLKEFEEFTADKDFKPITFENKNVFAKPIMAICRITRIDGTKAERVFTMQDADAAGLTRAGPDSPWKKYTMRMLQMRARSWALRDMFPDVMMGIGIREYDGDDSERALMPAQAVTSRLDKLKTMMVAENDVNLDTHDKDPEDADAETSHVNDLGYDIPDDLEDV